MASQWGNNSLAPGASAGWFFARPNLTGFLPVLQVMPLTPSFTDNLWYVASDGYPYLNELGVSTTWSQLSDDLSNLTYFMVVKNNSNSVVEYAFLEADSFGPSNVPAPSGGLLGNVNYFLEDGGNPLTAVSATVKFTVDFDSSSNGYSFQLNGYSTEGENITTEWQQFVIYASPGSSQLWARIDTWSGTALTDELNRIDVALANMPSTTIKAGYAFKMELTYTSDGTGTVTGAIYTVTDETGKTLGSVTITIVGQILRTTNKPATSANLAPIAALQYNIGGDYGGNFATLSSGAGTITYAATNPLSVVNVEPNYTDFDDGTAENANLTFGPLANTANQVVIQSFVVTPTAGARPQERAVGRRGHALPPPDNRSLGRHVLPPAPEKK
jgi:hypothetical protein